MLRTETTPLKQEDTVQNKTIKSGAICKYASIFIIFVTIAVIFYENFGYYQSSPDQVNYALNEIENGPIPISVNNDKESVTIEYDMDDLQDLVLDLSALDSPELSSFHTKLIEQSGYNSQDHDIQFFVLDKEDNVDITADAPPSSDVLKCGTIYKSSATETGSLLQVNCRVRRSEPGFEITGCASFERDSNGIRWGETGYYTSDCYTNRVGQFASISGRCCKVEGTSGTSLSTSFSTYTTADQICLPCACKTGQVAMGCTASDAHAKTAGFSGVQRMNRPNDGISGCKAQRSDRGDLWVAPYCASISSGTLDCKQIDYISAATLNTNTGLYESISFCPGRGGWRLTDCNAVIDSEMDQCTRAEISDAGTNYGGIIEMGQCRAIGTTSAIQAKATCCRVV